MFERIDHSRDATLRNLYEHHVHDMSEWLGIDTRADGAFGFDTSLLWQGDYAVYLAKVGDSLAGFGVVGPSQRWLGRTDVLVANKPALPFWRRAVRDYMQAEFEERGVLERGSDSVEREWVHLHFDSRQRT